MATVSPLLWYSEDPKVGFGLNNTFTVLTSVAQPTNMEFPAPPAKLGDTCQGNNNSKWVFVQASTTITAGNVIWISPQFKANNMPAGASIGTTWGGTQVSSYGVFGLAQFTNGSPTNIQSSLTQVTAQPNDYFWACLEAEAGLQINCATSAQANTAVYASGTLPGSVVTTSQTTTTASAAYLVNLYLNTAFSGGSGSATTTDAFTVTRIRTTVSTTT